LFLAPCVFVLKATLGFIFAVVLFVVVGTADSCGVAFGHTTKKPTVVV
jgi:hypothetical protein